MDGASIPLVGQWYVDARRRADLYQHDNVGASEERGDRRSADFEAFTVLLVVALCMTSLNFAATTQPHWFIAVVEFLGFTDVAASLERWFFQSENRRFNGLTFWAAAQILSYIVLPAVTIRTVLKGRLADYGLGWRPSSADVQPYVVLAALAIPFVVVASTTDAFQEKYPFLDLAPGQPLWPYMYLWWLLYAVQFVALEFFFRGFIIHGLVRACGLLAIPVMVVPYTMLHFDKPLVEALAAIVGGLVLGTLALKTRTVLWGALLHISVAMTMDLLAIGWSRW